jgi:CRISPR-associated protein Csx17
MSLTHRLQLSGCAPVPLAHYLKALGILRLVGEQADANVVARWSRDQFELRSSLDRDAILEFFLNHYRPTPVLAPWNGGSGFFKKDNTEAIKAIEEGEAKRLIPFREVIAASRGAILRVGLKEKPTPETKGALLLACRNELPEFALAWLDAAFVLTGDGAKYPPLLGTGGNDGRLEFTNNFMQRVVEVLDPHTGAPTPESEMWLRRALFADAIATPLSKAPVGQFFPGAAGGANATSGFEAVSAVNPWDYILMLEGALLFAAASVKRLESVDAGQMVYPFCVRQAGVGYGSASSADETGARAEMWLPLWERPATLGELQSVFGEGRTQVGDSQGKKRPARNGVDFTRAVVTLGVDRGLSAFQRYGFQVRNGLAYFATPLDRVTVRRSARADLLSDFDGWLERLRRAAGPSASPPAPASVSRALNQLEARILDVCQEDDAARLQAVLIALGRCEHAVSRSQRWRKEVRLNPLTGLSARWVRDADTNSPEFRLAAALSSDLGDFTKCWPAMRCHLEQVESPKAGWFKWADNATNDVQWSEAPLPAVLNGIFSRRLLRAQQKGLSSLPDTARFHANLQDIVAFIECETDDGVLGELLWGLSLVDWSKMEQHVRAPGAASLGSAPPSLYALLKLCFAPKGRHVDDCIPFVPAILHRAAAGDGAMASELAARRLRGSGLALAVNTIPLRGEVVRRTAAALLFPLERRELYSLRQSVLRAPETDF